MGVGAGRERGSPPPRHRVEARTGAREPVALSGSPGTGKSAVARILRGEVDVVEVRDLALARGLAQRHRGTVAVDLARLGRRFHRIHSQRPYEVYVGHLAHLLPIRDVVVLRCHPKTLARRLRRARRGSARDRRENVEAEAIDLVLLEALALGRRVWEIDTTRRTPEAVARAVLRRVRRRGPPEYGQVRWLADRRVTDYLLDEAR